MEKYLEKRSPLQDNFLIMYRELTDAINDFKQNGRGQDDETIKRIEAYLTACVHASIDYADKYLVKTNLILAFKYANNTMKHERAFETYNAADEGGFHFPGFMFPFVSPMPEVRWADVELKADHPDQRKKYDELLKGHPLLETFKPVEQIISAGVVTKEKVASSVHSKEGKHGDS